VLARHLRLRLPSLHFTYYLQLELAREGAMLQSHVEPPSLAGHNAQLFVSVKGAVHYYWLQTEEEYRSTMACGPADYPPGENSDWYSLIFMMISESTDRMLLFLNPVPILHVVVNPSV
jgi:hypothetical protein